MVGMFGAVTALVAVILFGSSQIELVSETVEVCGLHPALDGVKIVQLTDFHSTGFNALEQKALAMTAEQNPDIIAMTGDLCTDPRVAYTIASKIKEINPPLGAYFIMGNAEYDGDAESIVESVRNAGMVVLRNDVHLIRMRPGKLWILGVDDPSTGRSFLEGALLKLKGDNRTPRLLLAHFPTVFEQAAHWGIDVVLAGHTHGGQIRLPGTDGMGTTGSKELDKYIQGNFRKGTTWMHVSRGLGTSILPIRIGAPPEVTVITLKSASCSAVRSTP